MVSSWTLIKVSGAKFCSRLLHLDRGKGSSYRSNLAAAMIMASPHFFLVLGRKSPSPHSKVQNSRKEQRQREAPIRQRSPKSKGLTKSRTKNLQIQPDGAIRDFEFIKNYCQVRKCPHLQLDNKIIISNALAITFITRNISLSYKERFQFHYLRETAYSFRAAHRGIQSTGPRMMACESIQVVLPPRISEANYM